MALLPAGHLLPAAYRTLLGHRRFRRLLPAFAVSDLGDGMSVVTVAWLAIMIAPPGRSGLLVGAAVAAYALPGAAGALLFGRRMHRLAARRLLIAHSSLRAVLLGCVPLAWAAGALHPGLYITLLAGSSLLQAWGGAGKYALLAQVLPPDQRLAANALVGSSASAAVIVGPALAGLLTAVVSPAWVIGLDALSFAVLAVQTGRLGKTTGGLRAPAPGTAPVPQPASVPDAAPQPVPQPASVPDAAPQPVPQPASVPDAAPQPVPEAARPDTGLRLLRGQRELLGILVLTWLFNLLYGPVEVALPLHVTADLHAQAGLLGLYWAFFGIGAVIGSLAAGALRGLPLWPVTLAVVAGWGAALVPFGLGVPTPVSLACFAVGGVIYGPFGALTFTLFQDLTPAARLTGVLAVRSAVLLTASPLGTALGGPLTAELGPQRVLAWSGIATMLLAGAATVARVHARRRAHAAGHVRGRPDNTPVRPSPPSPGTDGRAGDRR